MSNLLRAHPTASELCSWVKDARQPTRHRNRKIPTAIRRITCTSQNFIHLLARRESRSARRQRECIAPAACALVVEDADDLVAGRALAHGDDGAVAVDGVRFIGYVGVALVYGLVAHLVDGGDEAVESRGGGIVGEPEGFAVVGDAAAAELLLLAVVNY